MYLKNMSNFGYGVRAHLSKQRTGGKLWSGEAAA